LRAKWFTVKDTTDEDTLRPTRSMETSDKTQLLYCLCSTKKKWRTTTVCSRCSRNPHGMCFLKQNCWVYKVCTASFCT
jgi:hypothetical protein